MRIRQRWVGQIVGSLCFQLLRVGLVVLRLQSPVVCLYLAEHGIQAFLRLCSHGEGNSCEEHCYAVFTEYIHNLSLVSV